MTWSYLYLKAPSEADLIAALPMLRGTDEAGHAVWLTSGPSHALDAPVPIVQVQAVMSADGLTVATPAVMEPGWHANLALADDHPQHDAILAAVQPYVVTPQHPQRVWE